MTILLLCEPRSGSTNLANWFFINKKFTVLFIPSDPASKWYQNNIHPKEYKYKTEHLVIKEDFYPNKDYTNFLEITDKVILLYRENETEQIQSWINSTTTNNWHNQYKYRQFENKEQKDYFRNIKKSFKDSFLDKDYFKISYEDLYYQNGIKKVINYIGIDELNNIKFPIGQKYRVDVPNTKNII